MNENSRHTLAVLVDSEPGVMSRVSRLFAGKGYVIQSLAMGPTCDPAVARMTIEVIADPKQVRLICSQLRKLICVHSVKYIFPEQSIRMELALIKVSASTIEARRDVETVASRYSSAFLDESEDIVTVSVVGDEEELQSVLDELEPFQILELVRTGPIVIERGLHTIYEQTKEKKEFDYGKNILEAAFSDE